MTLKEYEKSIEYFFKSLEILKKYPDSPPNTLAQIGMNIGNNYLALEQYENAVKYLFHSILIRKDFLDSNHPELACSYHNLANVLLHLTNFQDAFNYINKALEIYKKIFKEEHPEYQKSIALQKHINDLGTKQKLFQIHNKSYININKIDRNKVITVIYLDDYKVTGKYKKFEKEILKGDCKIII